MNQLENLAQLVQEWRSEISRDTRQRQLEGNPIGKELDNLNQQWGRAKAEYEKERQRLLNLLQAQASYRGKANPMRGRGKNPDYTDEIKIAAYLASLETSKSKVRVTMGIGATEKLNRVLQEGKDLHERNDW